MDGALDGSRPGVYFVNPLGATERSRTLSEVTAFHEAVPGHHYQLTIAAETDLPDIRRFAFIDAYIELKMQEVTRFRMTTHPVEFDMYYSA